MKVVIQRVEKSYVEVDNKIIGEIGKGLNILLGVEKGDSKEDITKLVNKIVNLRIFEDEKGKMNLSLLDINGEALIISQFTLVGNGKKGRRPSFDTAEKPERAKYLYDKFCEEFNKFVHVEKGMFAADMKVFILNDGPVTFIIDSKEL